MQLFSVGKPLLRRKNRNREGEEGNQANHHDDGVEPDQCIFPEGLVGPAKPCHRSGSKENRISRSKIVIFGVQRYHQREKKKVEDAEETQSARRLRKQKPQHARAPQQNTVRRKHIDLRPYKWQRRKLYIFSCGFNSSQPLKRREVVMHLP